MSRDDPSNRAHGAPGWIAVVLACLAVAACASSPSQRGTSPETRAQAPPPTPSSIQLQAPPPVESAACRDQPVGVAILGPIDPADHRAWFDSTGIDLATPDYVLLAREELPEILNPDEVQREVERASLAAVRSGVTAGGPILGLHVAADGSLLAVRVVSSSGVPAWDRGVLGVALKMRLASAVRGGCPVESWIGWPVGFRMIRMDGGGGG